MWSSSARDGPLLGRRSYIGRREIIALGLVAANGVGFIFISYFAIQLGKRGLLKDGIRAPPLPPPPKYLSTPFKVETYVYSLDSCVRLDTPFEFESPPDFTKLGIESWSDCREVSAKDGWKVEHCTAPGSTWKDSAEEAIEDEDEDEDEDKDEDKDEDEDVSSQFLFRTEPRPEGQKYAYLAPPTPKSTQGKPPPTLDSVRDSPSHCNPSGYFRVKRMSTPSTNYTLGSDSPNPESRCRNNPSRPISLNETTRDYVDNFAGPDTFRVVLDGPEYYISNQQINLGDCTYAIPYVLSRSGRFWLVNIEHGYDDYKGMNENFEGRSAPKLSSKFGLKFSGDVIQPGPGPVPAPEVGYKAYLAYKKAVGQIYNFYVCEDCSHDGEYQSWPLCSVEPSKAAREYGVLVRSYPAYTFEDLSLQGLEWMAARPSCRHSPRLVTFESPEEVLAAHAGPSDADAHNVTLRQLYGNSRFIPVTIKKVEEEFTKTQECLNRNRSIYFVGETHVQQLFTGVTKRLQGYNGDLQDSNNRETHTEQLGGVFIRQDFDASFQNLPSMAKHMVDPAYVPFSNNEKQLDLLEKFDTVVIGFGSWASSGYDLGVMWNSDHYLAFMKEILWDLAEVRNQRREFYKKTGFGYNDLSLIWVGMDAWPDTQTTPDMRTSTRMQYWDDLVNAEIERINKHYKDQGGMIDHLDSLAIILPFRKLSPDSAHHLAKAPVDAIVQVLIHKFDLCRAPFSPIYPVPTVP